MTERELTGLEMAEKLARDASDRASASSTRHLVTWLRDLAGLTARTVHRIAGEVARARNQGDEHSRKLVHLRGSVDRAHQRLDHASSRMGAIESDAKSSSTHLIERLNDTCRRVGKLELATFGDEDWDFDTGGIEGRLDRLSARLNAAEYSLSEIKEAVTLAGAEAELWDWRSDIQVGERVVFPTRLTYRPDSAYLPRDHESTGLVTHVDGTDLWVRPDDMNAVSFLVPRREITALIGGEPAAEVAASTPISPERAEEPEAAELEEWRAQLRPRRVVRLWKKAPRVGLILSCALDSRIYVETAGGQKLYADRSETFPPTEDEERNYYRAAERNAQEAGAAERAGNPRPPNLPQTVADFIAFEAEGNAQSFTNFEPGTKNHYRWCRLYAVTVYHSGPKAALALCEAGGADLDLPAPSPSWLPASLEDAIQQLQPTEAPS